MTPLIPSQLRRDVEGRFEAIYRRHVRDVYGFSLGMLGKADDAEDVTQTTFLNAYRALQRGEEVRNLRAWLLAIAHNVCRQRFRAAARRPREVELDPEAAEAFVDDEAPTAAEIREAMGQLSFNQRTVLVLREIEGLSYEEIAEAMGISLSAVETLLFRARRALREQLEAAENDLGCHAVERLISLQLDGKLSRQDKGLLRAHLRTCAECARFARSQRARKRVMPSLVALPLPSGLSGGFGVGAGGGGLVASKVAALAATAALVGTGVLVETGVVDEGRSSPAAVASAAATPTALPAWSPAASVRRVFAAPEEAKPAAAAAEPSGAKPQRARARPAKAATPTAAASGASQANAPAPAATASSPATSGASNGTGALAVAPQPPPVADVVGVVQEAVPSVPVSPPSLPPAPALPPAPSLPPVPTLPPPSLPPLTLPDVTAPLP